MGSPARTVTNVSYYAGILFSVCSIRTLNGQGGVGGIGGNDELLALNTLNTE